MCVRVSVGVGGGGGGFVVVVVRGGVYIQIHETSEATINFLFKNNCTTDTWGIRSNTKFLVKKSHHDDQIMCG